MSVGISLEELPACKGGAMSIGITLEELLAWNEETSEWWKAHLEAHPQLLELPCDIGGTRNVQEFVRHIWGVELRWSQRLAELPVTAREDIPTGPLNALFALHTQAMETFRELLLKDDASWSQAFALDLANIPPEKQTMSRRKIALHALLHGHRHWAQLATLVRVAGFSSGFGGDLLFSRALT
jgi:uncharacterized damage-inducible protein DinB